MKYNNKFQNPKKLRGGGAGELGFNYFYEKNKQYVKKWKEVLVNRQLFEMWHALPVEEQKVWIDKATSFDKLFAITNNIVLKYSEYRDSFEHFQMIRKYPKKEIRNFEYKSGYEYFMYALQEFNKFVHQRIQLNPTPNLKFGQGDPKKYDLTFLKQSFQSWKESFKYPNIDDLLILKYKDYIQSYDYIWEQLGEEGRQEWHDALDALEHAYDMFCEKTKITNPEMKVTDEDVKDHLSRMWKALDTETQNTWIISAGETLPVRQRRVRGLFEDSDSEE